MAVGLAMATKHLAGKYNRPGFEIVNNHTWCTVSDADVQEGIGCEAFSYAGHLKLNNLTVIYDNNQITCDGSVDLTNTEDVNAKMRAQGWDVVDIVDGVNDVEGILSALEDGKNLHRTNPLFINVKTIIGVGSAVAGKAVAHGGPLGFENIEEMKNSYGWDPQKRFLIPEKVRKFYADLPANGNNWVEEWEQLVESYKKAHPELGQDFQDRVDGNLPEYWERWVPSANELPTDNTPTRKSNGLVMSKVFENAEQFLIGTADLTPSINLTWKGYENFNPPSLKPVAGAPGSYAGRYIHFGVREHLMVAISNGLAAYSPGTILPITTSFLMFYLYAAAAVRMGALQSLHVVHVATHDSIGLGEDGPTHQPIEHAALFRAMPNMLYIRPADSEEVAGAWKAAINHKNGPAMISVSRQSVPHSGLTKRDGVLKGAYVIQEVPEADVTLVGVGAELSFSLNVAKALDKQQPQVRARVVSFPSDALFKAQPKEYQRSVLLRHEGIPVVVIEPYASLGWERWTDAGFTMNTYGHSAPVKYIYQHFGYTTENMTRKIRAFLADWKSGEILRGEWTELLNSRH